MGPRSFYAGVGRSYTWSIFLDRLHRGEPDAYLILIGTALGMAVAGWAGINTLKRGKSR